MYTNDPTYIKEIKGADVRIGVAKLLELGFELHRLNNEQGMLNQYDTEIRKAWEWYRRGYLKEVIFPDIFI